MLVDTLGLVLHALVHPANVQDRDGGILVLDALADRFPLLKKLFADGAYQGTAVKIILAKDSLFVCDTLRRLGRPMCDAPAAASAAPGRSVSWWVA